MRVDRLSTPALLVERSTLLANIARGAQRAAALGVRLRPHVKTHKCIEIGALQRDHGACGITVSTLTEAQAFAEAGFGDLTLAVPLAPARATDAIALARRITLRLLVDDHVALEALERAAQAAGIRAHVWLKIDCGLHRAGVAPESPAALALAQRLAGSAALRFDGLLTHAGHAYAAPDHAGRLRVAREERDAVVGLAARLRDAGLAVPEVSVGSTPTFAAIDDLAGVSEARPGNYAFFDLTQLALGCCRLEELALSVLSTVISHPDDDHAVIDAGALALSKDTVPGRTAADGRPLMGAICDAPCGPLRIDPTVELVTLTQEHGVLRPAAPGALAGRLPVGSRLRVLPNHACLAAACFDELCVVDGEAVIDRWRVLRGR